MVPCTNYSKRICTLLGICRSREKEAYFESQAFSYRLLPTCLSAFHAFNL